MSPLYSEALFLLGVGMITIFSILALIVLSGNLLIRLVNRFSPLPIPPSPTPTPGKSTSGISPQQLSAIVASVEILTEGQGKIVEIEPIRS